MFAVYANVRLLWKVLVAPVILVAVLAGVGTFATLVQRNNQAAVDLLMTGPVMQAETVADFAATALRTQVRLFRLMATAANESDPKKVKILSADALAAVSDMAEKFKILETIRFESTRSAKIRDALQKSVTAYYAQARDVVDMAESDAGSALMLMTRAGRSFADIEGAADELNDASKEYRDQKVGLNNALLERQSRLLLGILVVSVFAGVLVSVLVGRSIAKPIVALVPELRRLAGGDFNISFNGLGRRDEIGQICSALELAVEKVGSTIGNIKVSATELSSASAEIASSTTDLSQRTEEQAASLEQTSSSMEQISVTVRQNAENARQANRFAQETNVVAEKGGSVVREAIAAMARIEVSSRKISDIIGVIDEIARQTNLLALNAAVEAARAGDAGRGFGVVASEVRSLAQRSSQAAKDISYLITNSNSQVSDGVELVNRAGLSLAEIVASIEKVTTIVSNIADASNQQATGIDEINRALTQMDEVTQQNSALVEENAATAKTLESQARSMDERVSVFQLRDTSADDADMRPAPAGHDSRLQARAIDAAAGHDARPVVQMRTRRQSAGEPDRKNCAL